MKIKAQKIFNIRHLSVSCDLELRTGINLLTGSNGIGKSTFFHYLKNYRSELIPGLTCAFMDQFPLLPLSELRGEDIIHILNKDISWFRADIAYSLVEFLSLKKLLCHKVESYSGGENQLFKFILLLSQDVDCYFLDEPLQYLDDHNISLVLEKIQNLKDKKVLIIEHRKEKLLQIKPYSFEMKQQEGGITIQ